MKVKMVTGHEIDVPYGIGDCRSVLRTLAPGQFQTCVTSPPYWGLRDYGHPEQIGLEPTPAEYVAHMVEVFREVRRVLRDDGTLWLNLGDCYAGAAGNRNGLDSRTLGGTMYHRGCDGERRSRLDDRPAKNLLGIPWRVAFALQDDGWWLRQDIIWSKPNPMPESVTDRCTKAHEYLFLLSPSEHYFYDKDAIAEQAKEAGRVVQLREKSLSRGQAAGANVAASGNGTAESVLVADTRNARSVWTIATTPYAGAHFATMPPELAQRCVLAGSRIGDAVLDPFLGSGTVGMVAERCGRRWFGCELQGDYEPLIKERTAQLGLLGGAA